MAVDEFDVGEEVELRADFTDAEDQPASPSDVGVSYRRPDGTGDTVELAEEETGIWTGLVTVDQAGRWWWRLEFSGERTVVAQSSFFVRVRRVPEPEGS